MLVEIIHFEIAITFGCAYARNFDKLELVVLPFLYSVFLIVFKILDKFFVEFILLYFLNVARFAVEEHLVFRRLDVTRKFAAYRRDGQSRIVSGRSADRSRIGVGCEVGISLFAAEARAITVACRGYKADSAVVYRVVNLSYVRLIGVVIEFSRESAGRTERHIYRVDVEFNRVFQSRDYIFRSSAAVQIHKYFHEDELSVGSYSVNNFVFACDYARYVRAVFAVVRENVGVFIRIVVSERYFIAVPYVFNLKVFRCLTGVKIGKNYFVRFAGRGRF